jgi:hypothetical protein
MTHGRIFKLLFYIFFAGLFFSALSAHLEAITFDARKVAMGGTLLPFHSESYVQNPAYLKVQEESPLTIPVPIGLFVFLSDLPSFDPEDENFDAIELANLLLNPPFYLELRDIDKDDSTKIFFDVGKNNLLIDMNNLQKYMPAGSVETGLFVIRQPRVGYTLKDIHLGVSPFVMMEGKFEYSENFEQALAEAAPFQPNSSYTTNQHASINAGMAINAGYVLELQDYMELAEEPRVLAGVNGKYILGFMYGEIDNFTNLHTTEPIFNSENPPEVTMNTIIDYAVPESGDFGPKGHGFGFDFGLLLRYHSLDIGFGIQDVYTRINWRANRKRLVFDDDSNDLEEETVFEDRTLKINLPRTFAFSLAYRNMWDNGWGSDAEFGDYLLAYNLEIVNGDVSMKVGGETYYGPWPIALRLGTYNQGKRVQVSWGAGIPLKFFNFDIAFATHSSTFQQKRGLTMATSISFPR